jgi:hypothetical protein
MTHEEWKARIEQAAASYADPEAAWDAALSRLMEARHLTAQVIGDGLKHFFDNYPYEEAIDRSVALYNWMINVRTQECLSVVRSSGQDGEDESGVITYYEEEIRFFRERIRELEEARSD